uniref:Ketoreductase domain-containing protein n=1 Tax=Strigamia maritima TaxID=126957 RepID=T1J5Y3_STRMM
IRGRHIGNFFSAYYRPATDCGYCHFVLFRFFNMDLCIVFFYLLLLFVVVVGVILARSDCDLTLWVLEKWGKPLDTLAGKVVWIVGASSGIGEYLAYELAKQGSKLVLSSRREDELNRVKAECLKRGKSADTDILVLPMDVTSVITHPAKVQEVLNHFGQVDILVNNAGRTQRARWEKIDLDVDRQLFELNVFGIINLTRCLLPSFLSKKKGHIVTMSSLAGKMGVPGSASYTGSKHALHGYMESLRWEKSRDRIDVTMLCPGPVMSNLLETAFTAKVGEIADQKWSMKDNRMPTDRCARLCAVAIANKVDEGWICRQPLLLSAYGIQYLPTITRKLGSIMGYKTMMKSRDGSAAKTK